MSSRSTQRIVGDVELEVDRPGMGEDVLALKMSRIRQLLLVDGALECCASG